MRDFKNQMLFIHKNSISLTFLFILISCVNPHNISIESTVFGNIIIWAFSIFATVDKTDISKYELNKLNIYLYFEIFNKDLEKKE